MKKILLIILFPLLSYSQSSENVNIKTSIETFFDGFHQKDSLLMQSVLHESFKLESVAVRDNKVSKRDFNGKEFISAVTKRSDSPVWKEKLLSFNIKIDGPLANVWVDYEFWMDDKLSHCGVNSIHLLKKKSGWKIFNITDSRRLNCNN